MTIHVHQWYGQPLGQVTAPVQRCDCGAARIMLTLGSKREWIYYLLHNRIDFMKGDAK